MEIGQTCSGSQETLAANCAKCFWSAEVAEEIAASTSGPTSLACKGSSPPCISLPELVQEAKESLESNLLREHPLREQVY